MSSVTFPSSGEKPKFDPNKTFESVSDSPKPKKPKFNPKRSYDSVSDEEVVKETFKLDVSRLPQYGGTEDVFAQESVSTKIATPKERELAKKAQDAQQFVAQQLLNLENKGTRQRLIQEKKYKEYQRNIPIPTSDQPKTGTQLTAERLIQPLVNPKEKDFPVTEEDEQQEVLENLTDEVSARRLLKRVGAENPIKQKQIEKAIYELDAARSVSQDPNAAKRSDKILKNSKDIESGKLIYDVETGTLLKPENTWASAITGWKAKNKAFADFDLLFFAPKEKVIEEYERRRSDQDIDSAVPVPESTIAEYGQMAGSTPLKSIVAGGVTAAIPGAQEFVPVVSSIVGSYDYGRMATAQTFDQLYNALRDQGVDPGEAYEKAIAAGARAAGADAAAATAMSFLGSRIGGAIPRKTITEGVRQATVSAIKNAGVSLSRDAAEGLLGGATGALSQAYKNWLADKAGIHTDLDDGVAKQIEANLIFTLGIAAAAKAGKGLSSLKYKSLLSAIKNAEPEQISSTINEMVQEGKITEAEAKTAQDEIAVFSETDKQIPANVSDEARIKIQDKIKRRNDLEQQIEKTDKAFHPEIKEKIKGIDEEITKLAKEKIKISPELKKAEKAIDLAIEEGKLPDVMASVAKKDPEGFLKMIADQAYGRTASGELSDIGNAEYAVREQFGDDIVNTAKELYPLQEKATIAVPDEVIEGVEVSEHGEDVNTATKKENGIKPSRLSEDGVIEAKSLGDKIIEAGQKRIVTSKVQRATETAKVASEEVKTKSGIDIPVEETEVLNTWDIGEYDGQPEGSFIEQEWIENPDVRPMGGESFNSFKDRMEDAYRFVQSQPEDTHVVTHSKVMRALQALEETGGVWDENTTQRFLELKEQPKTEIYAEAIRSDQGQVYEGGDERGPGTDAGGENIQLDAAQESILAEIEQQTRSREEGESPGEEKIGITHAQMDRLAQELGFDTYQKDPERVSEWDEQAAKALQKPGELERLFTKLRNGEAPDAVETREMLLYMADLKAKINKNPSNALLQQFARTKDLFNIAGRIQGKQLRARQGSITVDESLADFLVRDMDTNDGAVLTEKQKAAATEEFNKISEAEKKYQDKVEKLEAENAKLKAAAKIKEEKATAEKKKKEKKDYSTERKEIFESISEKLKKARGETTVIAVPYAKELIAIAPDVAKLVRNLVEQGIDNLEDVVQQVHSELKKYIPQVKENDVLNIIAGEYNQKKQTKNDILEKLYDLRSQAKLVNKLEALENGEVPKSENKQRIRNQKIKELQDKIKEHDLTRLSEYKKRTEKSIEDLEARLAKGDFSPKQKKETVELDPEALELRNRLIDLKKTREIRLAKAELEKRSIWEKIFKEWIPAPFKEVRTIKSSFDYSAPLRQGLIPTTYELITNPKKATDRIWSMIKSSAKQKEFDAWMNDLKSSPDYHIMEESGLAIADPDNFTKAEEVFQSNLAKKIPVIGTYGIKGSERAYAYYLNSQRVDLFKRGADLMEAKGRTFKNDPEAYKKWASVVNTLTGRGEMPTALGLKNATEFLSTIFFSPRLMASRAALFNPFFYYKIPKELRLEMIKRMSVFIGLGTAVAGAASLLPGVSVETDPRNSDFMKIKSGDTRYDIWGGFQQFVRLFSQMATLSRKRSSGEVVSLIDRDKEGEFPLADVWVSFLRAKAAPLTGAIVDVSMGKNVVGQKTDISQEAKEFLIPILWDDIVEALGREGAIALLTTGLPGILGVGVQNYEQKKTSKYKRESSKKQTKTE